MFCLEEHEINADNECVGCGAQAPDAVIEMAEELVALKAEIAELKRPSESNDKVKNYRVEVEETLRKVVYVDAINQHEAERIVNDMYDREEIVLDYADYDGDITIRASL